MRTIERSTAFRKDFRRVKSTPRHAGDVEALLASVLALLLADAPLPETFRDHSLGGAWRAYRDCHLKPDLVLIYGKPDGRTLRLVRLGSHSELFG
jgi:mRNA interferase YafQ